VLRIEALAEGGRLDAARARGGAFMAAHPGSPLSLRVKDLLEAAAKQR
jgi:hypothetical protein